MRCASCNHYFDDSDRTRRELNATRRFVVQNPRSAKESIGFPWNALCTMSWGSLAELYLRARPRGGIGIHPRSGFVHVDTRGYDANWRG